MDIRKKTRSAVKPETTNEITVGNEVNTRSRRIKSIHEELLPIKKQKNTNTDVSEYELERLANIQRNEKFLASLGLNAIKSSLSASVPKAPPRKKEVSRKKTPAEINVPLRRSGRVTIDKLQEEILQLTNKGDIETAETKRKLLDDMVSKKEEGTYTVPDPIYEERRTRHDASPILFSDMVYDPEKYDVSKFQEDFAELLTVLQNTSISTSSTVPATIKKKNTKHTKVEDSTQDLQNIQIHNNEVARLTEARITAVCIHPTEHKIVVYAGDKLGNLGCWDVQKTEASELSGVYKYHPHVSNIARIHASPLQSTAIYSTSYDGTVRHFDIAKEQFTQAFEAPEELSGFYFTDADFLYDQAQCMYIGSNDGCAALIDFRASNSAYMWKRTCESGYKLNSIQQHPTMPHLLVTAEKNMISLYDVRKSSASSRNSMKALVTHIQHTLTISAATIAPDGEYLVSVAHDNTIRTWQNFTQPSVEADCIVTRHDNNTGRWLSTFRPAFDPKHDHVFALGSMLQPRRIEVYNPVLQTGLNSSNTSKSKQKTVAGAGGGDYTLELLCNLQDDQLASVCSRNAFHPSLNVLAGGNSSGRVHIFRDA